jgi:hypothetical protein
MKRVSITLIAGVVASAAFAQSSLSTGFEAPSWNLGNANQNGFAAYGNSPVKGVIQDTYARSGSQALNLRTLDTQTEMDNLWGVINGYHTAQIDKAGESVTANGPRSGDRFRASFWYRTPDAAPTVWNYDPTNPNPALNYGGFLQLNPAFDTNRYGWVGLIDGAQDASGFYSASDGIVVEIDTPTNSTDLNEWDYTPVAKNLAWGSWYRFEYDIQFVDGLAGNAPNDIFTVSIFNSSNSLLGSVSRSTWEAGFAGAGAAWGGAGPWSVNGLDFQKLTNAAGQDLGYIDDLQFEAVPEPFTMTLLAAGLAAVARKRRTQSK